VYSLVVLGPIPGTDIQISFWAWIVLTAGLLVAFKLYHARIMNFLADWWRGLDEVDALADPLHANRLHSRLHLTAR
jgi:hypothetical protein